MIDEFKLEMELMYDPEAPTSDYMCSLCLGTIDGSHCTIIVERPVIQTLYYDTQCFNQLMAIGFKLIQQIAADQEVQN